MIVLSPRGPEFLAEQLRRSSRDEVTYPDVGVTQSGTLPAGYRHDRIGHQVGVGETAWERARDAIRLWRAHAHAGITVTPHDALVQEGTTILASWRFGPMTICAPCRIVYGTDEPNKFGFAYGTLPGHPEEGEEAFHVLLQSDGTVTAEIIAFSRPADLSTKLLGPIARQIQKAVTLRYLEGIEMHLLGSE